MSDSPWLGDAGSLMDAFRSGERSPVEETEACLAAILSSDLNAFSHIDAEGALKAAADADVSQPFGGVPMGIKELEKVEGWPDTEACLPYADQVAAYTETSNRRGADHALAPGGARSPTLRQNRLSSNGCSGSISVFERPSRFGGPNSCHPPFGYWNHGNTDPPPHPHNLPPRLGQP